MGRRLLEVLGSLKLTVVCLLGEIVLVFVGTLAQANEGLYDAQSRYFRSLLVFWTPSAGIKIPVFPGGYLLGGVLIANLIAAHWRRFILRWDKVGLHLTHFGLILLLLGQLATDLLAQESALWLRIGETKAYSEDFRSHELILVDQTDPEMSSVYSIPASKLAPQREIRDRRLPLTVCVKEYWPNALVEESPRDGARASGATQGDLKDMFVRPLPKTNRLDAHNVPAAVVELRSGSASLGSWLVSGLFEGEQDFSYSGREYQLALRSTRYYKPYSLTLLDFTHETYKGTDIPKHFASRVRLENAPGHENRETTIYMNNPLRYAGATYYQASFEQGDQASMLQVVENPGWTTPYISCVLVGVGLAVQFGLSLSRFIRRRKVA
jgi:hypothetical protein